MKQGDGVFTEEHRLKLAALAYARMGDEFSIRMLAQMLEDENPLARQAAMEVLAQIHNDALWEKVVQVADKLHVRMEELAHATNQQTDGQQKKHRRHIEIPFLSLQGQCKFAVAFSVFCLVAFAFYRDIRLRSQRAVSVATVNILGHRASYGGFNSLPKDLQPDSVLHTTPIGRSQAWAKTAGEEHVPSTQPTLKLVNLSLEGTVVFDATPLNWSAPQSTRVEHVVFYYAPIYADNLRGEEKSILMQSQQIKLPPGYYVCGLKGQLRGKSASIESPNFLLAVLDSRLKGDDYAMGAAYFRLGRRDLAKEHFQHFLERKDIAPADATRVRRLLEQLNSRENQK